MLAKGETSSKLVPKIFFVRKPKIQGEKSKFFPPPQKRPFWGRGKNFDFFPWIFGFRTKKIFGTSFELVGPLTSIVGYTPHFRPFYKISKLFSRVFFLVRIYCCFWPKKFQKNKIVGCRNFFLSHSKMNFCWKNCQIRKVWLS